MKLTWITPSILVVCFECLVDWKYWNTGQRVSLDFEGREREKKEGGTSFRSAEKKVELSFFFQFWLKRCLNHIQDSPYLFLWHHTCQNFVTVTFTPAVNIVLCILTPFTNFFNSSSSEEIQRRGNVFREQESERVKYPFVCWWFICKKVCRDLESLSHLVCHHFHSLLIIIFNSLFLFFKMSTRGKKFQGWEILDPFCILLLSFVFFPLSFRILVKNWIKSALNGIIIQIPSESL